MPHTRSAKKNLRKSLKLRARNRATKKVIKLQIRKVLDAAKGGSAEELRTEYNRAAKVLDKAAARRVVHPNLAARKKSQLARLLNKPQQTTTPAAATT